ncbi:MAG: 50S ribosomal protein L17 [Calditrichaeota bacterium]|nr:50S ribosomal protein L17 [Calditrichota bacterium]
MRHRKKVKKLGRTASHRRALLRNLAAQIIQHHQVKTTLAKAKAARSFVERLITYGKKNTVHARRLAFKQLQNRTLVKMLFDEIAPTYADRNGGYTRVIKLGQRRGDGAQMAILQLVGFEEVVVEEKPKARRKARPKQKEEPAEVAAAEETPPAETPVEEKTEKEEEVEQPKEPAAEEKKEAEAKESPAEPAVEEKPAESEAAGEEKASVKESAEAEKAAEKSESETEEKKEKKTASKKKAKE